MTSRAAAARVSLLTEISAIAAASGNRLFSFGEVFAATVVVVVVVIGIFDTVVVNFLSFLVDITVVAAVVVVMVVLVVALTAAAIVVLVLLLLLILRVDVDAIDCLAFRSCHAHCPAPFQATATMLLPGEVTATAWLLAAYTVTSSPQTVH